MRSKFLESMVVLALVGVAGCMSETSNDDEFEALRAFVLGDEIDAPSRSPGGGGTWLGNGLEDPDVSGLNPDHGLTSSSGLRSDIGLLAADGVMVVRYVVECALPVGESIYKYVDGELVEFEGRVGLAPEWETGACDEDCQQWVSACLLARTNVTGKNVPLWVVADHPSVGFGTNDDYPLLEATFYGNLFADPPALYFCRGSEEGVAAAIADGRTCSDDTPEDCGFVTFGSCFEPERCIVVDDSYPTDCADGDSEAGVRYASMSTFVSVPEE